MKKLLLLIIALSLFSSLYAQRINNLTIKDNGLTISPIAYAEIKPSAPDNIGTIDVIFQPNQQISNLIVEPALANGFQLKGNMPTDFSTAQTIEIINANTPETVVASYIITFKPINPTILPFNLTFSSSNKVGSWNNVTKGWATVGVKDDTAVKVESKDRGIYFAFNDIPNELSYSIKTASGTFQEGSIFVVQESSNCKEWTYIKQYTGLDAITNNETIEKLSINKSTRFIRIIFENKVSKSANITLNNFSITKSPDITNINGAITCTGDWTSEQLAALDLSKATSLDLTAITIPTDATLNTNINPNCLIYAAEGATVPDTWNNVVINGTANKGITITDGYPFWNTKPITGNVTYTRNYDKLGTGSLILPFDASVNEGGIQAQKFTNTKESIVYFEDSEILANTPYIVDITTAGTKTFEGTSIPVTTLKNVSYGDYTFKGTYSEIALKDATGLYILDPTGKGFATATDLNNIPSFRSYIEFTGSTPTPARLTRGTGDGGATNISDNEISNTLIFNSANGILSIQANEAQIINVYSISGQIIKKLELNEGNNIISDLNKGIYVINNQKVVVK